MLMDMLRICLCLLFLLISDVFTLPRVPSIMKALALPIRQGVTTPDEFYETMTRFMTFVMPLTSMTMAFRTINMMAGLNAFMQTLSFMQSVLSNAMNRPEGMRESVMSSMMSMMNVPRDMCLQRLVCEMAIGARRRKKRDIRSTVQGKSPQGNIAEQKIVINVKIFPNAFPQSSASSSSSPTVSTSSRENTCENLFKSCPYSARDMSDALKKYVSVWRQVWIPKLWRPPVVEPLYLNRAFNVFG